LNLTNDEARVLAKAVALYAADLAVAEELADDVPALRRDLQTASSLATSLENVNDQQPRTKEAAAMNDTNERSAASAGSQPAAWANEDDDGIYEVGLSEARAHYILERAASGMYSHRNPRIIPLYRSPTLTDEEREALEWAEVAAMVDAANETVADDVVAYERRAATLRVLRERLLHENLVSEDFVGDDDHS
jgi:hypothetical protein